MDARELTKSNRGNMGLLDVGRLVYIVVHRTELMGDSTHVLLLCHRVCEASKLEGNGVSREKS